MTKKEMGCQRLICQAKDGSGVIKKASKLKAQDKFPKSKLQNRHGARCEGLGT